jgi:hypothetical protein
MKCTESIPTEYIKKGMETKNHVIQQDFSDSMDADSVNLETVSVITNGEDEEEKVDALNILKKCVIIIER